MAQNTRDAFIYLFISLSADATMKICRFVNCEEPDAIFIRNQRKTLSLLKIDDSNIQSINTLKVGDI
ncbi:uncharacterized protein PHALS_15370 [Plasmopara halstedii]|uniref:Uncharacterized protein n=1 Tax=Plasmopara halstedii TaxID=4781 RepID=A0A0P1A5I5_PLAHL|nr:uncharacterized protein PHALS_15370 [Plasmopara halstedii]CEG35253.1 hypothetical protein PHALS_15370 [Plasmopara halstedii]|eukprot:XP_024571622.1 hypothetical protein PHALS_15370 [Plasmopara halstedii]